MPHDMVDIEALPAYRKEWLQIHDGSSTWGQPKIAPGTCTACVWGDGQHTIGCVTRTWGKSDWMPCFFCRSYHPPKHRPRGICPECVAYWRNDEADRRTKRSIGNAA